MRPKYLSLQKEIKIDLLYLWIFLYQRDVPILLLVRGMYNFIFGKKDVILLFLVRRMLQFLFCSEGCYNFIFSQKDVATLFLVRRML